MLDYGTAAGITIGFSIFTLAIGYALGKLGISGIEADISTIKGLLNGNQKVTVVAETPVVASSTTANTVSTAA